MNLVSKGDVPIFVNVIIRWEFDMVTVTQTKHRKTTTRPQNDFFPLTSARSSLARKSLYTLQPLYNFFFKARHNTLSLSPFKSLSLEEKEASKISELIGNVVIYLPTTSTRYSRNDLTFQ